jgi:hypothetical protein
MENHFKYSWLVELNDKSVVQINGDSLRIDKDGLYAFADNKDFSSYLLAYLPCEKVKEVQIMNQMTGQANGIMRL